VQPAARTSTTGVALTAAQVAAIIRDAPDIRTAAGLELLDVNLNVLTDLTADFQGGSVSRASYATLHGTATLQVARDLNWGTAILRPYMTITDGMNVVRFNLGAYLTSSPKTEVGEVPVTHEVDGYDILHWLNTPVGQAHVVPAGTGYLAAAEAILQTQGIVAYQIDQAQAAVVLAAPRVWVLDSSTTWLMIVNDLVAGVGYQGVWSDWDGRLRITPYQRPLERGPEWLYAVDGVSSMIAPRRTITRDYFAAPNRWVFYWSQDPSGATPVEGAGVYTYVNNRDGPTSVAERGGRVITAAPQQVDAVDQSALIAQAQAAIDADLRLKTTVEVPVSPNPLHWHFDRIAVADPLLGSVADALVTRWTLPLDGSDGTQEWSVL
jgi:hypothetical protein